MIGFKTLKIDFFNPFLLGTNGVKHPLKKDTLTYSTRVPVVLIISCYLENLKLDNIVY